MMEKYPISWQAYLSVWSVLLLFYYTMILPRIRRPERPPAATGDAEPAIEDAVKAVAAPVLVPATNAHAVPETSIAYAMLDRFLEETERLVSAARSKHYSKETFLKLATQLAPYLEKDAAIRRVQIAMFRYGVESCHLSLSRAEIDDALANPPPS